jgi:hypothetical protein
MTNNHEALIEKVLSGFNFTRSFTPDMDEQSVARLLLEAALVELEESEDTEVSTTLMGFIARAVKTGEELFLSLAFVTEISEAVLTKEGVML